MSTAAVIGAGGIGRFHLEKLLLLLREKDCPYSTVAFSRTSDAGVKNTLDDLLSLFPEASLKGYSDHRRLVIEENPSYVVVATPTEYHSSVVQDLLLDCKNLHSILVEKPSSNILPVSEWMAQSLSRVNYGVNLQMACLHLRNVEKSILTYPYTLQDRILDSDHISFVWHSVPKNNRGQGVLFDLGVHCLSLLPGKMTRNYKLLEAHGTPSGVKFDVCFFDAVKATFRLEYKMDSADCQRTVHMEDSAGRKWGFSFSHKKSGSFGVIPVISCNLYGKHVSNVEYCQDLSMISMRNIFLKGSPVVSGKDELQYLRIISDVAKHLNKRS